MDNTTIRILLADDHEFFRDGLRALLSKQKDIEVIGEAGNGEELVLLTRQLKPDVILTDIQMPGMNGIAATTAICQQFPGIGVIALSMFDDETIMQGMLDAGAKGYMLKSASKAEVIEGIRVVHAKNYYYCKETSNKLSAIIARKEEVKEDPIAQLTERELEILQLICKGLSNAEISEKLFLSIRTIEGHKRKIQEKLRVQTVAGIVIWAVKHKVFEP